MSRFEDILPEYGQMLAQLREVPNSGQAQARQQLTDIEYRIVALLYEKLKGVPMPQDDKLMDILSLFRIGARIDPLTLHAAILHVFKDDSECIEKAEQFALRVRTSRPETLGLVGREIDALLAKVDDPLVGQGEEEHRDPNTMAARKYPEFAPKKEIVALLPVSMKEKHVQLEKGEASIMREMLGRVLPTLKTDEAVLQFAYTLTSLRSSPFREVIGTEMNVDVCIIFLKCLLMWDGKGAFIENILPPMGASIKTYITDVFRENTYPHLTSETRLRFAEIFVRQLIKQRVDRNATQGGEGSYKGYGMMQNVFLCSKEIGQIFTALEKTKKMFKVSEAAFERIIKTGKAELVFRSTIYWREMGMAVRSALAPDEYKKWLESIGRPYTKIFHAAMRLGHVPHLISESDSAERVINAVKANPKIADDDAYWRVLLYGPGAQAQGQIQVRNFYVMPSPVAETGEDGICKRMEVELARMRDQADNKSRFDELLVSRRLFEPFLGETYIRQ